jgi:N-sulfoglucosamine sulfohydrolase
MHRYFVIALLLHLHVSFESTLVAKPPNIVVLLADDHSALDMSVYGAADIPNPNLDQLAAAGMVFEKAFVNSPSCAPSRAAFFTGMYPAKNGAEPNHSKVHSHIKRMPNYLKDLGYEVVSFGKVSHYAHVTEQGFDRAENYGYHDHQGVAASVEFLKERKSDQPLALFFGTNWPHVPLPEPESVDPSSVRVQPMHIDTPEFRHYRARYINAVKKMDEEIGIVYQAAQQYLGTDNTFYLQTADHGAQLPFGKWNLYDEGTRVSLIVRWDGKIAPKTRTPAMVQWIDILPTLVDVAGGSPVELDGRSFRPVFEGKKTAHRDAIFTTHSNDNEMNVYPARSVRTDRWKYIRNLHPEYRFTSHMDRASNESSLAFFRSWAERAKVDANAAFLLKRYSERPAEELYDLDTDPFELKNLAEDSAHISKRNELRAALDQWLASTGDTRQTYAKPLLLTEEFSLVVPSSQKKKAK